MRSKKLVKRLSLTMALAMGLSVASGCTGKSEPVKESNNAAVTTAAAEEKPLKFSISTSNGLNQYVLKSPDINEDKWVKEFEKRFNADVTIKLLDHSKFLENMQMMFASGDIPDVVKCYGNYLRPEMSNSVQNGVFMAIDDLLAQNKAALPNIMNSIPENAWTEMKYEGKTYGIPGVYLSSTQRRGTFIRKDILDKLGLKAPKTLDETVEVLKAFKKAGIAYPYAGRSGWKFTDVFFGAFGVGLNTWNLDKNGNLVPDITRPEMKEALQFHAMLNKEGLMDPESLTTSSNDWLNKIYAGKVGMFDHQPGQLNLFNQSLKKNVPDGEFMLIPSPEGPKGIKGMYKYSPVIESFYINRNFKEPLRLLKLVDKMGTDEAKEFFSFGILGQDYQKKDGKIDYTMPTDPLKQEENGFREKTLVLLRDDTVNKLLAPYKPTAVQEQDWRDNIGSKEGFSWSEPVNLKSLTEHPDLTPSEDANQLFNEYSAKIFYGQLPATAHDDFVKEYLKRGGDQVIKEATEAYKTGKVFKR